MATAYLKYGFSAKPIAADRNGEAVSNWIDEGNQVVGVDTTFHYTGTNSFTINASGAGDFTSNYIALASGNNATFTVGRKYCVSLWCYCLAGATFQIKTGGVTSSATSVATGSWLHKYFTFTALTATTALQMILTASGTIWFELDEVCEIVEADVLIEKGMTDPDQTEFFPGIQNLYIDGSMDDNIQGFRRKITIITNTISTAIARKQLLYWLCDSDRTIDYETEVDIAVTLEDPSGFEFNWLYDCSLMKSADINVKEKTIRTSFPV